MLKHSQTNYLPHLRKALGFSLRCQVWSLRAAIHAFIPSLYRDTSVQMVKEITNGSGVESVIFEETLGDA